MRKTLQDGEVDISDRISPHVRSHLETITRSASIEQPVAAEPRSAASLQLYLGTIVGTITSQTEEFLKMFAESDGRVNGEFLGAFLINADRFAENCSRQIAAAIKKFTTLDDVRNSSEATLANLLRHRCFDAQDAILEKLIRDSSEFRTKIRSVQSRLSLLRFRDIVVRASLNPGAEPQRSALLQICDYLNSLKFIPESILEYAATRAFGPGADLVLCSRYAETLTASLTDKLTKVIRRIQLMGGIGPNPMEAVVIESIDDLSAALVGQGSKTKSGSVLVQLGLCILFALPIIYVSSFGHTEPRTVALALVSAAISIVFFYRTISRLAN